MRHEVILGQDGAAFCTRCGVRWSNDDGSPILVRDGKVVLSRLEGGHRKCGGWSELCASCFGEGCDECVDWVRCIQCKMGIRPGSNEKKTAIFESTSVNLHSSCVQWWGKS